MCQASLEDLKPPGHASMEASMEAGCRYHVIFIFSHSVMTSSFAVPQTSRQTSSHVEHTSASTGDGCRFPRPSVSTYALTDLRDADRSCSNLVDDLQTPAQSQDTDGLQKDSLAETSRPVSPAQCCGRDSHITQNNSERKTSTDRTNTQWISAQCMPVFTARTSRS